MGCLIRLKDGAGFLTFNSEEAAKDFIIKNKDRIETLLAEDKKHVSQGPEGFENTMLVTEDQTTLTLETLRQAAKYAYDTTGEEIAKMNLDEDWNTEEYDRESKITGVGKLLKSARNSDGTRLFAEYINSHYLNNLTQKLIIETIFGNSKSEREKLNIHKEWFDTTEESMEHELKDAKYWASKLTGDYYGVLSDDQIEEINSAVKATVSKNIKTMLYGELMHKIVEMVIRSKNNQTPINLEKIITTLIDGNTEGERKTKGWVHKYKKIDGFDVSEEINHVKSQFLSEHGPTELALAYLKYATNAVNRIEASFKHGSNTTVKLIPEARLLCNLKKQVSIEGNPKDFVQAKLDIVVLVDGVPNIVDLKVSLSGFEDSKTNPKSQKIYHTMAAYQLLARKSGLPEGGGSFIESVEIDENGGLKNDGSLVSITRPVNVAGSKKVFSELFDLIETAKVSLDKDKIDKQFEELIHKAPEKKKRQVNVEKLANKINVQKQKDGTYTIRYNIFDDNMSKKSVTLEKISAADLEATKQKVAETIAEQLSDLLSLQFESFKNNLKTFTSGNATIDVFLGNALDRGAIASYTAILNKYKSDCRVLNVPELDAYNIILIETPVGIDVLNFTEFEVETPWDPTLKDAGLFDDVNHKYEIKKTVGSVQYLKTLLVVNELLPKLDLEVNKLNDIRVIRLGGESANSVTYTRKHTKEMIDIASTKLRINNSLKHSMSDPLTSVLWQILNFKTLPQNESKYKLQNVELDGTKLKGLDMHSLRTNSRQYTSLKTKDKIIFLRNLAKTLEEEFPLELDDPKNPRLSDVALIQKLIYQTLAIYENNELLCESDATQLSLSFASMDLVSNQNVQVIRKLVGDGITEISDRYHAHNARMRTQIRELKSKLGYNIGNELLGHGGSLYKNMFDPKYPDDLVLKNPWKDNTLRPEEVKFLKFVLFTLNKYNHTNWESVDDMKETDLETTDYYFPLVRAKHMEKILDRNGKFQFPKIRSMWEEVTLDAQKIREGFASQLQHRESAADGFKAIYNEFSSRKDEEIRREFIEAQRGIDNFSYDIETALDLFVVTMESEDIYNNYVIPAAKGVIYTMKFQEIETGTKLDNIINASTRYMKSVVYDSTVYGQEYQKYMRILMPLRTAASNVALAYNIKNLPRELIMGMFTTVSRCMFSSYGKNTFSFGNYMKAFATIGWDMKDFVRKVTKIELLNEHFRMTNMSISELHSQTTSNKVGFAQAFDRWSGWCLVAPDYFNRMTMFIAQMMEDGCWDAYSVHEDGEAVQLKYDMSKDKRFDIYYTWMKNSNGNIDRVPASVKREFLNQKALYEAMKAEFNESMFEGRHIKDFKDAEDDSEWMLPKAYTNRQRDSLKSFSDLCFGYYDKETKSDFYKTAIGVTFKQFMAYGSSKLMQYWKHGSENTARGEFKQLTTVDGELVWNIRIKNEEGQDEVIQVTDSELNSKYAQYKDEAEPPLVWTGTFIEGVFNSYLNFFKDMGIGSKQALFGADPSEKSAGRELIRKTWKAYSEKGSIIRSNMLQLPYDLFMAFCFMWIMRLIYLDDPEKTGESYKTQVKNSGWGFQFSYGLLNQITNDFNILSTIRDHFLEWSIPTVSILWNMFRSFFTAYGDPDLNFAEETLKGLTRSVGAFKVFKPAADFYFDAK